MCGAQANQGIGYLTCAKLASEASTGSIVLACRDSAKAQGAVQKLVRETGRPESFFSTVLLDLTSLTSVRACVAAVTGSVDVLLLNAGGIGGDDHLMLTPDGITRVCAMNVTGSAALFEGLLEAKKLAPAAVVVYASSEIARGMAPFSYMPKFAAADEACMTTHLVGQPGCGYFRLLPFMKVMNSYGYAKAIGTLYFQNAAADHPKMRIVAASPGSTHSTSAANGTPKIMQCMGMATQMWLMSFVGMSHAPSVAAQRYLDVLLLADKAPSGTFLASSGVFEGELVDQAPWYPQLWANRQLQQAAAAAVKKVIAK